jgi:hypothetical protein
MAVDGHHVALMTCDDHPIPSHNHSPVAYKSDFYISTWPKPDHGTLIGIELPKRLDDGDRGPSTPPMRALAAERTPLPFHEAAPPQETTTPPPGGITTILKAANPFLFTRHPPL